MAKLGDICFQITDGSHNPPAGIENSKHLMLSSKNINDDEITTTAPRFLTDEQFDIENKRTNVLSGDLLMTIVGTVGRVAVVPEMLAGICLQRSVAVIKPNPTIINNRYLMYQLQSMRKFLESEARGVAQKGIYLKQVGDLSVITPPLEEQYRVVDTLDHISGLIHIYQQQLTKLDELIKARFVEMFGDPKLNPYRFPCNSLSTYITFLTSGSRGWSQYFTDSGEYFITIKNVKNCKITLQDVQYVAPPDNAEAKRTKVQKNDLLISITADLGRTGVVTEEIANHGAYINQHLTCIRLKDEQVNPLYVAYYMESDAGKEQFTAKNQSAVKAGLNFNAINSLKLMAPPLSLQNQFADFVAEVDKSKVEVQKALDQTQLLFDSLMQQYFG
ncbi:MAG: restriction endonuclease subunit S [Faecalibacterium sp.]